MAAQEKPGLTLLDLKAEEGQKECGRQPLEAGKGKKTDSLLEPVQKNAALPTP